MSSMKKRKGDHRMIRMKARRVLAFMLVLMMLLSGTTAFAADVEDVPYYSYCYWEGPSRFEAVPMRAMFEATKYINGDTLGTKALESAEYVTLSPDKTELYVLDSGNSRILVIDTNTFTLKKEIATIPFSQTDYVIAKQTQKVKPNTDYVLFWWTKLMEGEGNLELSIRNTATNAAIAYQGEAFSKELEAWGKNVMTFNTGDASEIAVEIGQSSDDRCVYQLDEAFLVEKAVLEATATSFNLEGPIKLEFYEEGGTYRLVTSTKVGDKTLETKYNLIVDGYYQETWAYAEEAMAAVFANEANLYDHLSTSDFEITLEPSDRGDGSFDVSMSIPDTDNVEDLKAQMAAFKVELQKITLKETLDSLEAVFATDFNSDMGSWTGDCGSSRDVVQDLDEASDAGSMKIESTLSYKGALGMYVSAKGEIYLADTENFRILIMDSNGYLNRLILKPEDPENKKGIPKDLEFKPKRIVMDNKGYLFVVSSGCYYGMLVYDETEDFKGFHGSYKVEATVLDTIEGWITGLFMTNEKNAQSQKKLPQEILDISIDADGMLYTLSGGGAGQVKRLGLNGNQTLNHKFGFQTQSGDLVNFSKNPAMYWHKHDQYILSMAAITVDSQGFSYVLDKNRGRIFMYDEECRAVCSFSTGFGAGDQVGTFVTPQSIVCSDNRLFVVDFVTGGITVFELTEYGRLFKQADVLTIDGEYEKALPIWQKVLKMDANNQRAYEGVAKAMLSLGNKAKNAGDMVKANEYYEACMNYAEMGHDQQTYSEAFSEVQTEWLTNNFWWIFLLCLALVGGIAALLVLSKKRKLINIKNDKLRVALTVPFHPFQAFQAMKYQKFTSAKLSIAFLVIFYLCSVSEDLYGGFMYVITDVANYNAIYTLIGTVGILLLWVIVNWGICILNDGKGSLKEVFTMSAYSMTPLIVYSVIFTVGSHVIAASETSTFGIISTIMFIYTALLLLIGMTVVHEYTFFKSMKMAILTILGMLLAAFVIFSVILLTQQFVVFFVNIIDEIALR